MNHPKWKYHATLPAVIVDDAEAEQDLGLGWHDTPAEAQAAASAIDAEDAAEQAEIYRKELLAKAAKLGLKLHPMTGVEKIQAAIDAQEAE